MDVDIEALYGALARWGGGKDPRCVVCSIAAYSTIIIRLFPTLGGFIQSLGINGCVNKSARNNMPIRIYSHTSSNRHGAIIALKDMLLQESRLRPILVVIFFLYRYEKSSTVNNDHS
jgi:hypothetical protein